MLSTGLKIGSVLLCIAAIPAISGCAHSRASTGKPAVSSEGHRKKPAAAGNTRTPTASSKCKHCNKPGCVGCKDAAFARRSTFKLASTGDMPPHATSGECYAQVYLPPQFDTATERVCVREESEKIEVIPAEYEWVEERVLVKEASTQLVEVPAQFDVQDHVVQTSPGHASWIKADEARCAADTPGPRPQDVFCLVSEPPTTMTIQTERVVKGPMLKEVAVPAEYQTIRRQKLVRPASTRKVMIPAEFREFNKTVMVAPGRMEWQRVNCDPEAFRMNREFRPVRDRNP